MEAPREDREKKKEQRASPFFARPFCMLPCVCPHRHSCAVVRIVTCALDSSMAVPSHGVFVVCNAMRAMPMTSVCRVRGMWSFSTSLRRVFMYCEFTRAPIKTICEARGFPRTRYKIVQCSALLASRRGALPLAIYCKSVIPINTRRALLNILSHTALAVRQVSESSVLRPHMLYVWSVVLDGLWTSPESRMRLQYVACYPFSLAGKGYCNM